jgi:hypothetical protein
MYPHTDHFHKFETWMGMRYEPSIGRRYKHPQGRGYPKSLPNKHKWGLLS